MKQYLNGNKVEKLRKEKGLTKQYISKNLGYKDWKMYWNLTNGKSAIVEKRLVRLEEILNTDRSYFLKM